MTINVRNIIAALEQIAPLPLQESYDNAGLQVGLTEVEVSGALLCLDVTEQVLQEAVEHHCNMVIAHHPLLFRGVKHLGDATLVERCLRFAVKHDIAIYAAHTNLDSVAGGVNYKIAEKLGLSSVELIQPKTYRAADGTERAYGAGVIAKLPEPLDAEEFLLTTKSVFGVHTLFHNELLKRPVTSVAICGGAGDFLLDDAVALGADAFLTGEMHYHQYFGYEQKIQIGVLGHYQSEKFVTELFRDALHERFPSLPIYETTVVTNPICYM
jgi:dinuclear metal center YbgI/SA1388 family protein